MVNQFLIFAGKTISLTSKLLNLGNGSTWPGHIALSTNTYFISETLDTTKTKVVFIAGTNGKTTTSRILTTILNKDGKRALQNTSGANLRNGIASTLILSSNVFGKINQEYAIFEIDENALPILLREITPHAIILLNLFRDQLDRYGEIDSIAKKWTQSLDRLPTETTVYLNADDPQIAYIGEMLHTRVKYFGLEEKRKLTQLQHAADSIYCPQCHSKLQYQAIYYSHLGNWACPSCKLKRPRLDLSTSYFPLSGTYNKYNTLAAVLFAQTENINAATITSALHEVTPAFGRQETLQVEGKSVQLFLAKNPTSFNQSLETILQLGARHVLFVLNDRIPDGRDVSWIWDIDVEEYLNSFSHITIAGDRVYDMALRLQYTTENQKAKSKNQNEDSKFKITENLESAVNNALSMLPENETLFILPTYSAMLEVRKILTGKKIL